jgi:hypothetical protein
MQENVFPILLLIARPAAGKSEIIKYLSNLDESDRINNFHVGHPVVIDDFPFLWRWFEEDTLLEEMGKVRLFSDSEGYFKYTYLWDLLIKMINLEYEKLLRDTDDLSRLTVILEFSRGKEHGGYKRALPLLSPTILEKLSILYVNVPWEESLRKNRSRFNPDKPDSILEHGLPDEKMERLYRDCDFLDLASSSSPEVVNIRDYKIPYAIFENADDVTTAMGPALGNRLQTCLDRLWQIHSKN